MELVGGDDTFVRVTKTPKDTKMLIGRSRGVKDRGGRLILKSGGGK